MKTRFIILFLLIGFIAIVTKAQVCDIKGDWTGKLSVYGNEIPLYKNVKINNFVKYILKT